MYKHRNTYGKMCEIGNSVMTKGKAKNIINEKFEKTKEETKNKTHELIKNTLPRENGIHYAGQQ